jgi:hypothetical protein
MVYAYPNVSVTILFFFVTHNVLIKFGNVKSKWYNSNNAQLGTYVLMCGALHSL